MYSLSWRKAIKGRWHGSPWSSKLLERCWSPVALNIIQLSFLPLVSFPSFLHFQQQGCLEGVWGVHLYFCSQLRMVHLRWMSSVARDELPAYIWKARSLSIVTYRHLHQRRRNIQSGGEDGLRSPLLKSVLCCVCFSTTDSSQQLAGFIVPLSLLTTHAYNTCCLC